MARASSRGGPRPSSEMERSTARKAAQRTSNGSPVLPTISGFRVLRLGAQVLYIRVHQQKGVMESTSHDSRTLFVVNLPTDTTERHVRAIFAKAGPVEVVQFWDQHAVSDTAHEDGAASDASDEGVSLTRGAAYPAASTSAAKSRKAGKKPSGPPEIAPLPPSDPRHPHRLHTTSVSAHVTFLDASSTQRALNLPDGATWPDAWADLRNAQNAASMVALDEADRTARTKAPLSAGQAALQAGQNVPPMGLEYLIARYRAVRPAADAITKHVDSVIANYTWMKENPQARPKGGVPVASYGPDGEMLDEDGFTIVHRGGRFGRTAETGADASGFKSGPAARGSTVRVASKFMAQQGTEADVSGKKKSKELQDFYRFQVREKKREQLASLREQFEKDKQKVEKLKSSRRFNPY